MGFVGPQYANVGFRYGYIGDQPPPTVHAPASDATPPVAPSTPFPSAIYQESQPTGQAPPDPREPIVVGVDIQPRTDDPLSNANTGEIVREVNGGAGMNASARAHSPPIWNLNSLLPGNPDVHIRTPAQPTAVDATGVGGKPQANAGNAGRGACAGGNAGRGRGTGARGNAGGGRGTGVRGNAGRGTGARGRGGRASAGRGTGVGGNGGSANGRRAPGVTGNGGRGNGVNATGGTGNVPLKPENYLSNSLSALNEEEAEDNEPVRGTRTDLEVPIADWNGLGVEDTPAAKREMCMGILYGVSEATLKKYRGWAREYKLFMAHELQKLDASRFGEEASLRNANLDEIGAALEQNMGGDWKMAEGDVQWFHGPETNPWCLRKYVTFLANEMVAQADRMATLKRPNKTLKKRRQCSTAMLMGRLKALNLLIKLDGAIFRKPVLNLLRDFAECRIWVRVQYLFFPLRTGIEKQIPSTTHHDWAAKILGDAGITYSPVVHATRAGGAQHSSADGMPSDQLARLGGWRFIDVMTKHYLTTIPREAVLLKAGFTGVDGDYFIGRATVPVSEKLEKQLRKHIFPWAALVKGQKQCHDYNGKMVSEDKAEKQDTAGLNILKELDREARMAVTQDLTMYYIHQP
ncbi:unnamed protein product [Closterium sp. NIES-64]|nr:unnamed protein product [Closterium sp. NIES-64]